MQITGALLDLNFSNSNIPNSTVVFPPARQNDTLIWQKKKFCAVTVAPAIYSHQQWLGGSSFPSDRWGGPTVKQEQKSLSEPKPHRVVLIVCSGAVGAAYLIAAITNFPSQRQMMPRDS